MSKSKRKGTANENLVRDLMNKIPGVSAKRVVGSGMFAQGDPTSEFLVTSKPIPDLDRSTWRLSFAPGPGGP